MVVLADGFIGQMMEPVNFPTTVTAPPVHDWAVRGDAETHKTRAMLDLHMLTIGGKERSRAQFETLLAPLGIRVTGVKETRSIYRILDAVK